jgi:hypothetical protein
MEQELDVYNIKQSKGIIKLNEEERKIDDMIIPHEILEKQAYRVLLRKIKNQQKEIEELSKLLDDNKIEYKKDLNK